MRRLRATLGTLVTLALFAAGAVPALAAGSAGQWWGAIDGYWAQPLNLGLEPGVYFNTHLTDGGKVVTVPFDHEFSTRLRGGWRDAQGDNTFSVSYWTWDHGAAIDQRRLVIPTLSDPVFGNVLYAAIQSDAAITSRVADFMVSRKLTSSKKGTWFYGVGLRHASFEEKWKTKGFDIDPNTFVLFVEEQADVKISTAGTGITMGLGSSFQWSPKWRTSARAQLSMLEGSTDASYLDRFIAPDPNGGFNLQVAQLVRPNDRRVQQQLELEARVSYNVWKTLDINLGYNFFQWSDVSQFDRFADDVQSAPNFRRDNVAYHGVSLGVSYWF
ncbi:MAG: hypothetical protein HY049_18640 [Acidobacteria bacterium]|nr:hypothetical protein [Acidobacteriota bacterium]